MLNSLSCRQCTIYKKEVNVRCLIRTAAVVEKTAGIRLLHKEKGRSRRPASQVNLRNQVVHLYVSLKKRCDHTVHLSLVYVPKVEIVNLRLLKDCQ